MQGPPLRLASAKRNIIRVAQRTPGVPAAELARDRLELLVEDPPLHLLITRHLRHHAGMRQHNMREEKQTSATTVCCVYVRAGCMDDA